MTKKLRAYKKLISGTLCKMYPKGYKAFTKTEPKSFELKSPTEGMPLAAWKAADGDITVSLQDGNDPYILMQREGQPGWYLVVNTNDQIDQYQEEYQYAVDHDVWWVDSGPYDTFEAAFAVLRLLVSSLTTTE